MPARIAPDLLCHTWLLEHSYVLCNVERYGFPIQYASAGFADLFEACPSEFLQKKCGAIVGVESIQTSEAAIDSCATASGLNVADVRRALDALRDRSVHEVKQMGITGSGSFITLNRTLLGRLIVVSVVIHILRHPSSGRRYAIGFQCDFTNVITISELFHAALQARAVLAEQSHNFLTNCLGLLSRNDVIFYLHRNMEEIWLEEAASILTQHIVSIRGDASAGRKAMDPVMLAKDGPSKSSSGSYLHGSSNSSTLVQKLNSDGYHVSQFLACSLSNPGLKVLGIEKEGQRFAIKCVTKCEAEDMPESLHEEFEILQNLAHPNIVKVVGLVVAGDGSAMLMEHIPGETLSQRIHCLSTNACHEVLSKVLSALAYLHSHHHIAHGDVKAKNVMVHIPDEQHRVGDLITVKLIDFGCARRDLYTHRQSSAFGARSSNKSYVTKVSSLYEPVDGEILPPPRAGGRGSAFQLDVFAAGLIIIGLLAKHETFTRDMFHGPDLKIAIPDIAPATEQYVHAVLNPNPALRPKMDAVWRDLPPVQCWFTADQPQPLEATEEKVEIACRAKDPRHWPTIVAVSCAAAVIITIVIARPK